CFISFSYCVLPRLLARFTLFPYTTLFRSRADCTTRNKRKAQALRRAYDDLEQRIERLQAEEELAALRPDLDGDQIMQSLGIAPGPVVGRASKHMRDIRLDRGPLDEDEAREELLRWWAEQPESR